jgi:hypothetical protein
MTCYAQLKQEEMRKRLEEEKRRQKQLDAKKHFLHLDYMAQDKARMQRSHEAAEEGRRQEALQASKRREAIEGVIKRKKPDYGPPKNRVIGEELQIFTPLGRGKKPAPAIPQKKSAGAGTYSLPVAQHRKTEEKKKAKPLAKPLEPASLSLSVAAGLPVSLSVGQKQVQVALLGKNASAAPMAVSVDASVLDSQKSPIASKPEPRTCTIGPEGESQIKVAFDLPEDAARGMLTFTALLKENAIYIGGKQAAESNAVSLSSQVKSPMDLQYKQGSAAFEPGALVLTFQNVGESGGILETSSSVTCFSQGGEGRKSTLSARTKVKGGEKGIRLAFAPAEGMQISRLELSISGTDSNGKPYSLKRKIGAEKAPGDEGEGKGGKAGAQG